MGRCIAMIISKGNIDEAECSILLQKIDTLNIYYKTVTSFYPIMGRAFMGMHLKMSILKMQKTMYKPVNLLHKVPTSNPLLLICTD